MVVRVSADDAAPAQHRRSGFASRLLLGTGGMTSLDALRRALLESGTTMATVAVRRVEASTKGALLSLLEELGVRVLPNTAGCATASEAVLTAKLAREAFGTEWVKLEVVNDDHQRLPDAVDCLTRPNSWPRTGSSCCRTRPTTPCWPCASNRSGARR